MLIPHVAGFFVHIPMPSECSCSVVIFLNSGIFSDDFFPETYLYFKLSFPTLVVLHENHLLTIHRVSDESLAN